MKTNIAHIEHRITSDFLYGLILMVMFTLILVYVETESEKIFLKYGRIGKHPMESLYTGYYCTL